jgi:PAS domain-containing protein
MEKKPYTPPRIIEYVPDQVPQMVIQLFSDADGLPTPASRGCRPVAPTYTNVVDDDRRFVRVSDSFCELLGYRSQELIGKTFDEILRFGTRRHCAKNQ